MLNIDKDRRFVVSGDFLTHLIALGNEAEALVLEELKPDTVVMPKLVSTDRYLHEAGYAGNQVIHCITVSDLAYELATRQEFDLGTLDAGAIARLMHHTDVALDRAGDGFEFGAEITIKAVQYFLDGCKSAEDGQLDEASRELIEWQVQQ
jgi:hypothetical protein